MKIYLNHCSHCLRLIPVTAERHEYTLTSEFAAGHRMTDGSECPGALRPYAVLDAVPLKLQAVPVPEGEA